MATGYFNTELLNNAFLLALRYHQNQTRKAGGEPYISHPVGVALLLARAGYGETVIAAGFCHDLLEDTPCTPHEIGTALGDDVLRLVLDLTEPDKSLPWEERKLRHLEHIRHASHEAMAIAAADKIYNLQSMYRGYRSSGADFFAPFKRGVDASLEQARLVYTAISSAYPDCPLLPTFADSLEQLERAVKQA